MTTSNDIGIHDVVLALRCKLDEDVERIVRFYGFVLIFMNARLMVHLMFYGCALRLARDVSKDSEVQTLLQRYGFLDFTRAHLIEKYKDVKKLIAMNRLLQQTYVRNKSERSETEIRFMIGNYQHQYSLTDIKDFYGCKIDGATYVFQSFPLAKARPLCKELFSIPDLFYRHQGMPMWKLIDIVADEKKKYTGLEKTRAAILVIIGSLLVIGNCNGYIPGNYLKIVENHEEINNYSWGKTYIKSVHEALSTKKDNTKISCALGPIIEILRIRPVEFSMKVPLCETWFDVMHYYVSGPNFLKLTHDYKLETTISEYIETENVDEGYRVDEEEEDLARTLSSFLEKKGKRKKKKNNTLLKSTELVIVCFYRKVIQKQFPAETHLEEKTDIGGEDDEEFNKYSENNVTEEEYNMYSENNVAEGYRVDEEYCTPSQRVEEEDLECTKLVIVEDLAEDGAKKKKIIQMDNMDRMPLYSENNVAEGYRVDEEYCTPYQRVEEEDLACTKLHGSHDTCVCAIVSAKEPQNTYLS
ncbi:hypothetical protein ACFE04_002675 [Oxalis oulophora]